MVLTSAIPVQRAEIAIAAMQHGKDVMTDKPGMTSLEQLAEIRRVQAESGRIFSVLRMEPGARETHGPMGRFRYAVEAREGFFKAHGIAVGRTLGIPDGP